MAEGVVGDRSGSWRDRQSYPAQGVNAPWAGVVTCRSDLLVS
ncbi:hypothetical protein [Micromonospora sp. DT231]